MKRYSQLFFGWCCFLLISAMLSPTSFAAAQVPAPAPQAGETVLYAFNLSDASTLVGDTPDGGFVFGADGALYGTTYLDNYYGGGTVFRLTTGGDLTTLHFFCVGYNFCPDGDSPRGTLMPASDGSVYGITSFGGGSDSCGVFFNITAAGVDTTLYTFANEPAICPSGMLLAGSDGNYYGTTSTAFDANTSGTVFKMTPGGVLTVLNNFGLGDENGINSGGAEPANGSVAQGADGTIYGMTNEGGTYGLGTIYSIAADGSGFTVLHSFSSLNGLDGALPIGGLIRASDGNFYGTTARGGLKSYGTVFKLTPGGQLTIIHRFEGRDGAFPYADLMQGADGYLYGTTNGGGRNGTGTVFKISTAGRFTSLYSFDSVDAYYANTSGAYPNYGALIMDSAGNLYGMTETGGTYASGVAYKISP